MFFSIIFCVFLLSFTISTFLSFFRFICRIYRSSRPLDQPEQEQSEQLEQQYNFCFYANSVCPRYGSCACWRCKYRKSGC